MTVNAGEEKADKQILEKSHTSLIHPIPLKKTEGDVKNDPDKINQCSMLPLSYQPILIASYLYEFFIGKMHFMTRYPLGQ